MEYSQAIKNLKTNILKIKEGLDILDKSSNRKSTSFIQEITKSIKDFEFNTKKLKLDLKSIGIESKQIEKGYFNTTRLCRFTFYRTNQ